MKNILFLCVFLMLGCTKKTDNFVLPPQSISQLTIDSLDVSCIVLDSVTTSFVVNSNICDGNICVMDNYFCTMYRFYVDGRFKVKNLGWVVLRMKRR